MKTPHIPEIDIDLGNFPDDLVRLIKESIDDTNYARKISAGKALEIMGKPIIPHLHKLLSSKNAVLRKRAAGVVKYIADRKSVPFLIRLLDDKEFDIRWIAALGLIRIGRRAIVPVLKSIRDGKSSYFLNLGAHHVFDSLFYAKEKRELNQLLLSLENFHELGETAPTEASIALKTKFK
jgi:hypothetical protein